MQISSFGGCSSYNIIAIFQHYHVLTVSWLALMACSNRMFPIFGTCMHSCFHECLNDKPSKKMMGWWWTVSDTDVFLGVWVSTLGFHIDEIWCETSVRATGRQLLEAGGGRGPSPSPCPNPYLAPAPKTKCSICLFSILQWTVHLLTPT